jgi:hypothetical protein
VIFVVLIKWRRDLLIVYVLIFVIFCDFPGSGLFEREQRQLERERAGLDEGEMSVFFISRIMKGIATVFPNTLGNTVETQWRRLNIRLLLWDVFVVFSLFFPK